MLNDSFLSKNCVSTTVAHFLTAAVSATSEVDEDGSINGEDQRKIFEQFLAQFAVQVDLLG